MIFRNSLLLLLTLTLLVSVPSAISKEEEASALIQRAKQLSDIRVDGAPAFRLKLSFKIINEDGSVLDGAYTEDWVSEAQWRRETVFGNFRRTQVATGRKLWLLDSTMIVPEHMEDILSFSESSKFNPKLWTSNREVQDREVGGSSARCIDKKNLVPWEGRSALCFDKISGALTAEVGPLQVGSLTERACRYTDYQKFGDRIVARSYDCDDDKHLRFEARVVELAAEPATDPAFFAAPDGAKESVNCLGPVKPPAPVYSPEPTVPPGTPQGSTTRVMMSIVVSTEGKPHDVRVISTPNHDFDQASLKAVRQWRFEPATCDGERVEKDMVVMTQFTKF
jgi:TonB family protein